MAKLTLIKVQRKDPKLSIRVECAPISEAHATEVEEIAQACLDQLALAIQKQPQLPFDGEKEPGKTYAGTKDGVVATASDGAGFGSKGHGVPFAEPDPRTPEEAVREEEEARA